MAKESRCRNFLWLELVYLLFSPASSTSFSAFLNVYAVVVPFAYLFSLYCGKVHLFSLSPSFVCKGLCWKWSISCPKRGPGDSDSGLALFDSVPAGRLRRMLLAAFFHPHCQSCEWFKLCQKANETRDPQVQSRGVSNLIKGRAGGRERLNRKSKGKVISWLELAQGKGILLTEG